MKRSLTVPLLAALAVAGCGSSGGTFANKPRPAAPIVVAAAITPTGVTVSPAHFGAGLVQLVVTNLTGSSQQLTVQSNGFQQQTSPINPQDTAELKANLGQGQYSVTVSDPAVKSAKLAVGQPRSASSNQLLQP